MTLREWLNDHRKVMYVDFTFIRKDGTGTCGYATREELLVGGWDIPKGIANRTVIKAGIEDLGGDDIIGFVDVQE